MKVVVSGGLGFIGSRLARAYHERGASVVVLDSMHPQIHRDDAALREAESFARVIVGDVRNPAAWDDALPGADLVLHMAAETGTGQSMDEIARYTDVNVTGTAVLLDALARTGGSVRTLFLPSSRAVYGEGAYRCGTHGPVYPAARRIDAMRAGRFDPACPQCGLALDPQPTPEWWEPRPSSVYATTKLAQEQLFAQIGSAKEIDVRVARYQNVYGPGQALGNPYTGVLVIFAQQVLAGGVLNIYEDGAIARDFVYVDDTVAATLAILGCERNPATVNVGSGKATTLLDIVRCFSSILGRDVPYRVSGDFRAGDIRYAVADVARLREIGFERHTPLESGLRELLESVQAAP